MKNRIGCVNFQDILKENLKDPEFRKYYKLANKKTKLEDHFNGLLQAMGIKNLFVEVKDIDEY
jgi:hypothetical protein